MDLILRPVQLTHPRLRAFSIHTAWIATVTECLNDFEDLLVNVPPDERVLPDFSTPWPWACDSFIVVYSVAKETRDAAQEGLEESVAAWLGEDPENWPVLRMTLIDPWQERPGLCRRRPRSGSAPSGRSPPPRT